ncbi:MAG: hypothetical protein AB1403_16870 [Candidatus Riflebacteria bacterium]
MRKVRVLSSPLVLALGIYLTWLYFSFGPGDPSPKERKIETVSLLVKACNKDWFAVSDEVSYFLKPFPEKIETYYSGDSTHETAILPDVTTQEIELPFQPKRNRYNLNHYFPGFIASFLGVVFVLLFMFGLPMGALYCLTEVIIWEKTKSVLELLFAFGGFLFCVFFFLHYRQQLNSGNSMVIDNAGNAKIEITYENENQTFVLPPKSQARIGIMPGSQSFIIKHLDESKIEKHQIYVPDTLSYPASKQIVFNIGKLNTYRHSRRTYTRR